MQTTCSMLAYGDVLQEKNMNWFIIICGILLLIGGLPLVWKFAVGVARIILSIVIFVLAVLLILGGIGTLAALF